MRWVIRDEAALNRVFGEIRATMVPDKPYDLIYRRYKRRRSVDQNSRMWAIFGAIADYSGDDIQSVHDEMCRRYLGVEQYKILGMDRERVKGTSGLTVEEMTDFMAQLEVFCAEWGVAWEKDDVA